MFLSLWLCGTTPPDSYCTPRRIGQGDKNGTGKSDPAPPHFEQAPRLNLPDTAPASGKTNKPIRHDSPKKNALTLFDVGFEHGLTLFDIMTVTPHPPRYRL